MRHRLGLPDDVLEPPRDDVRRSERDHRAELALLDQLDRLAAEARRQHAIEAGRRAAALQVAEHHRPRFLPGLALRAPRTPARRCRRAARRDRRARPR